MRRVFRFFVATLVFLFTFLVVAVTGHAQVLINEFLADPARDWDGDDQANYRDDEWVEIINFGSTEVDCSGFLLADGEGEPVWRYGFSGILAPREVRVIYGSDSRAWEESNGFPMYGLSLNNAGDRLSLYRVSGSETLLVDTFTYGDRAAEDDRSVGRGAQTPDTWFIFDAYNPCPDNCDPAGSGCIPTPGLSNDCITGTELESWGKIKGRYRS